jgi:propionyl-CoA carboxylase alpha chain
MFYDPMICKLVTFGEDRAAALDRLRAALDAYVINGVGHNIPFLRDLTEHPRFIAGALTTQFIAEEYPRGFSGVQLGDADHALLAAGAAVMHAIREATFGGGERGASPEASEASRRRRRGERLSAS